MQSEEDRKRERKESNVASAKRSRERQKAKDKEIQGQFAKNAERISALERTVEELSSELKKNPSKKPSRPDAGAGTHSSANRRSKPSSSRKERVDSDRPHWFGDPF